MRALAAGLVLLAIGAHSGSTPLDRRPLVRHITITGVVRDAARNAPIDGATIVVAPALGQTSGAHSITNALGRYAVRLDVSDTTRDVVVTVRRLGYDPKSQHVAISADSLVVDLTLTTAVVQLQEIVVTSTAISTTVTKSLGAATVYGTSAGNAAIRIRGATAPVRDPRFNTEEYAGISENDFVSVRASPLSTFSADVDHASYTNVRRFIREGQLPPKDAVRIEELINYFPFTYPEPANGAPITIATDVAPAPWNHDHEVVRIGLHTARIATEDLPPSNLVFLLDVSGSMDEPQKLPLVKQALRLLVNELRPQDRVAIVVYAGAAGLALPSTPASEKERILDVIEQLEAGGSTAGGEGIRLAYDVAREHFRAGGNNRVILATDGDFNVGVSSTSELVRFVEERRDDGTFLTVLGFGMGNIKDARLEQLADKGNGNYAYIDDLLEARKMFVHEMGATLVTVAKDVKLQVEFNPDAVQAYRLIGYENRLLRDEEFNDDRKDAGDMGAGHSVTALYEIVPVGATLDVRTSDVSPLRYQESRARKPASERPELAFVKVRYKAPTSDTSQLLTRPVLDQNDEPSTDLRFAMAVAGYGMLLRESPHRGRLAYEDVVTLARGGVGVDPDRYRREFVEMVMRTSAIASVADVRSPR